MSGSGGGGGETGGSVDGSIAPEGVRVIRRAQRQGDARRLQSEGGVCEAKAGAGRRRRLRRRLAFRSSADCECMFDDLRKSMADGATGQRPAGRETDSWGAAAG